MPGMTSGLTDSNSVIVAAFRAALAHQSVIMLGLLVVLGLAWAGLREWRPSRGTGMAASPVPEPTARRVVRVGFGVLWILDGLLQAQPAMPAGLPAQVIQPAAATSPGWVQHLVSWAAGLWTYHPIQASAAVVWIQLGIGAALLAAPRGRASRLAGLVSAGWAAVVWVAGEAFGGILAPGLSLLTGAPGGAALYLVAGVLVACPYRGWQPRPAGRVRAAAPRLLLDGLGVFFLGMALLQAWPGRGSWQGTLAGRPGPLTSMVRDMAATPQPGFLAGWLRGFAGLTAAHGFALNLTVVIVLTVIGAGLMIRRPAVTRLALALMVVTGLAVWILVQDLGVLGGLGTDPNSMIPVLVLACAGYLGVTGAPGVKVVAGTEPVLRATSAAPTPGVVPEPTGPEPAGPGSAGPEPAGPGSAGPGSAGPGSAGRRRTPGPAWAARLVRAGADASPRALVAAWAAGVVLIGAAPAALAQASAGADPIIAQALDGSYAPLDTSAPAFRLTDQDGTAVSLASLRGKVVLLTFLDPVCTSDCPLIAQEFRQADQILGARSREVELVAIVANPLYSGRAYTVAFDRQEHLSALSNWRFLTGPVSTLSRAWRDYDVAVDVVPAGSMVAHADLAFVIDGRGRIRAELSFDPGPGTASSQSSFAVELTNAARQVMRSS
jgi:cytochrome oxidase Cu insertion factor (SCO1/SenC/PrrC family)